MKHYRFHVISEKGKERRGQLQADSWEYARKVLRANGDTVLVLEEIDILSTDLKLSFLTKKITQKELGVFCRQFLILEESGIGLLRTLELLERQTANPWLRESLSDVKVRIKRGESFSEALKRQNHVFSGLFCCMIHAGEASGNLSRVLCYMAEYYEKVSVIRNVMIKAMIYPAILLASVFVVTAIMILYIVPIFSELFDQMETELGWFTIGIIEIAACLTQYGLLFFVGILMILVSLNLYFHTRSGAMAKERIILCLPWIGELIHKLNCARFARNLSMMLGVGMPITDALRETAETMEHGMYEQQIINAGRQVKEGKTLSVVLSESDLFLPLLIQMIGIGEETGNLETMLERAAIYYEAEVFSGVEKLTAVLEPVIVVLMSAVVMGISGAVLAPLMSMYNMIETL